MISEGVLSMSAILGAPKQIVKGLPNTFRFNLGRMTTMADRIRRAREDAGLNKSQLARAVGVSAPTVTDWENGTILTLKAENLFPLAAALKRTPEWILSGREPRSQPSTSMVAESAPPIYRVRPEHNVTWRLSVTDEGLGQLIAKETLKRGFLDLRLEKCPKSGEWSVVKSGWQPLNTMKAPHPATLLRAVALLLESYTEPALLENNASQRPSAPSE